MKTELSDEWANSYPAANSHQATAYVSKQTAICHANFSSQLRDLLLELTHLAAGNKRGHSRAGERNSFTSLKLSHTTLATVGRREIYLLASPLFALLDRNQITANSRCQKRQVC
jgi:hypothetical protein